MTAANRIAGFDGMRAIAFMLVFASHKVPLRHSDAYGDVGVWTFFVLSGFLITLILAASREEIEAGTTSMGRALVRFYLRRTARIFPVYYLVLGVAFVVSMFVAVDYFWGGAKLAYALYLTNIYVAQRNAWIGDFGHLWSLAIEEQFYLLFAPLVLLTPRKRTAWLCLGFVALALATKIYFEVKDAPAIATDVHSFVNFGMLGFGGLVGLAAARSKPSWLTAGWLQALAAACLLAYPVVFGGFRESWALFGKLGSLIAGLLLFQIACGQGTWFVAVLQSAPLRLIGRVSYGAYLFHPFIHFQMLQGLLGPAVAGWTVPQPIQILTEFAVTLALATVSWVLLERPILEWAARSTKRAALSPQPAAGPV